LRVAAAAAAVCGVCHYNEKNGWAFVHQLALYWLKDFPISTTRRIAPTSGLDKHIFNVQNSKEWGLGKGKRHSRGRHEVSWLK